MDKKQGFGDDHQTIEQLADKYTDIPESTQYQDVGKSLKINKEIKGLEKYVREHILTTLNKVDRQKTKEVIECLKVHMREKLKELVSDQMKFR